jgi:hypothetical protein
MLLWNMNYQKPFRSVKSYVTCDIARSSYNACWNRAVNYMGSARRCRSWDTQFCLKRSEWCSEIYYYLKILMAWSRQPSQNPLMRSFIFLIHAPKYDLRNSFRRIISILLTIIIAVHKEVISQLFTLIVDPLDYFHSLLYYTLSRH